MSEASSDGASSRVRRSEWPPTGVASVALLTGVYALFFATVAVVVAASAVLLVYAAVLFVVAYLTWHRHHWGWWGCMVVYGVGAILSMGNILAGDGRFAVAVTLSLVVLWFLLTHHELFFDRDDGGEAEAGLSDEGRPRTERRERVERGRNDE
jgi:lysylphosphatidylglycerol synthetase-like protein (DUF2156 family)